MKRSRVYLPEESQSTFLAGDERRLQRLIAILESSFDGIFITDDQARTIWCNHSYQVISGLSPETVLHRSMRDLERDGIVSRSATLMAMEQQEPVTIEQVFQTGKRAVVTSTPIFDEKDRVLMVVTNVRDISELAALQETLEKHRKMTQRYQDEIAVIRQQLNATSELVAEDPAILNVLRLVGRVALLDTVVLIQGETGVGKERIATYLHQHSTRKQKNFIRVNCGAIPESLAESELFGYERGAFTGANREGKMGLFEAADHGTIFLDEVGELPLNLQTKLLRVLQEHEITRVGGNKAISVDVRVLAATNRDLRKAVEKGTFREDLYYRLNVFPVTVPPLRERKRDIPKLAKSMLDELNHKYAKGKILTAAAQAELLQYPWPGNVRELRNVMERAFIMSDEGEITPEDLPLLSSHPKSAPETPDSGESYQKQMERFEAHLILQAFEKEKSVRGAARKLKMDPATYLRKKKKYEGEPSFQE